MAFRSIGTQKKKFTEENYSTRHSGGGSLMIWVGSFSSSGKLKLQFVCGRQKAADYVKMLNDLSLAQGHRLCGREWIFQQDNVATHNASITKKYLLGQKIRLLDHLACSPNYRKFVRIDCCKGLWRRSTALSNFCTQKRNLKCMGKIPSVQLQKLIDSMPSRIFDVIKANGGYTKY